MKRLLWALSGLLSIAATTSMIDDGLPPQRYMGDVVATTRFVSDIHPYCGKDPAHARLLACQQDGTLTLPNPCNGQFQGEVFARLTCHEMGHANGWPGNHPRP
jgi:hypothetical protein